MLGKRFLDQYRLCKQRKGFRARSFYWSTRGRLFFKIFLVRSAIMVKFPDWSTVFQQFLDWSALFKECPDWSILLKELPDWYTFRKEFLMDGKRERGLVPSERKGFRACSILFVCLSEAVL